MGKQKIKWDEENLKQLEEMKFETIAKREPDTCFPEKSTSSSFDFSSVSQNTKESLKENFKERRKRFHLNEASFDLS